MDTVFELRFLKRWSQRPCGNTPTRETFSIIRPLDLTRADYSEASDWLSGALKSRNADAEQVDAVVKDINAAPAKEMLAKLKQAGAKELFGVLTLTDIPSDVGWVVIPIPAGANGEAISKALVTAEAKQDAAVTTVRLVDGNWVSAVVNDVVIYGRPAAVDRLAHAVPVDHADLAKALQDGGDAPIILAIAPSDDTRKVIEQMMPQIPPIGSPATVITHGIKRATVTVNLPPAREFVDPHQSDSPEAARRSKHPRRHAPEHRAQRQRLPRARTRRRSTGGHGYAKGRRRSSRRHARFPEAAIDDVGADGDAG